MINYYSQFIPDLSTLLKTLYSLLKVPWQWSGECQGALEEAKRRLTSSLVLAHYDPEVPLVLVADASAYGLGVVLSHRWPDGTERPIAFASRTLNEREKNYPQVEKEALALAVGVKKFNKYVYGRVFNLVTDHQPLTIIFGPKRGTPTLPAARMQRGSTAVLGTRFN